MKTRNIIVLIGLAVIVTVLALYREPIMRKLNGVERSQAKAVYYCPMHPTYTSDRPGDCPICNMRLVKKEGPTQLSKLDEPKEEGTPSTGYTSVVLDSRKLQLIGVKKAPVEKRKLTKAIRTVGRVVVDETRVVQVQPKVEGWVEEIYARYVGDRVKRGEALFSFYSPDFVSTQSEYLTVYRALMELPTDASQEIRLAREANLESAKKRLLWWDITEAQVETLEKRGVPSKILTIHSPIDGVVMKKNVYSGQFMERGADFYQLADLSTVWVEADIYEHELPWVRVGQEAVVRFHYNEIQTFQGKLIYIAPLLKPETRTAVIRFEFSNLENFLRPGEFLNVRISVDLGEKVSVPKEAIMDTGVRKVVFVSKDGGIFEPRDVTTGVEGDEGVEIVEGVRMDELVVTSGNFLMDSESRLKAAMDGATTSEGSGHGGHEHAH